MWDNLKGKSVILASQSPRRQELIKGLGFDFEIKVKSVEENFPKHLVKEEIPLFLSQLKAEAFKEELHDNQIVITCDTIVWINNHVLNKPENREEAFAMLNELSGNCHEVYTAVRLTSNVKQDAFFGCTKVFFKSLSTEEINYYLDHYKPFDKAGSYGVQEWIGYIAIEKLEGCFYNVMGLPLNLLYTHLKQF